MSTAPPAPRTTPRGTPCAVSWAEAWVARVTAREQTMNRRICGARTIGGTPCPLHSDHPSGRCRHHGGFPLTGAPEDNRNAVVHGLYSRRLMICGSHCPAWQSCPLGGGSTTAIGGEAGFGGIGFQPMEHEPSTTISPRESADGVDAVRSTDAEGRIGWKPMPPKSRPVTHAQYLLTLPLAERPQCSYELAEYNATVTDVMQRTCANADNAFGLHLAHQIALITVMVSRAARALAVKPFTEKMEQSAENYYMSVDKPSAALIAFEKLSRELRRWIAMLDQHYAPYNIAKPTAREHELRQQCDTGHDPDWQASLDLTGALAQKETARATAARNAQIDEIDRRIVDSLFARFKVKPQGQEINTEAQRTQSNANELKNDPPPETG